MRSFTYNDFVRLATRIVPRELRGMLDDPAWHAPKWHQYGLLTHVRFVIESATRIFETTSVDVRLATALHDAGKIFAFEQTVRDVQAARDAGREPKFHYIGHERRSAGFARNCGHDDLTVWLVRNHDASYRVKVSEPREFVVFCGDNSARAKMLVAICAADAAGKGWTEANRAQRPEISARFAEVGTLLGFDPGFAAAIERELRRQ